MSNTSEALKKAVQTEITNRKKMKTSSQGNTSPQMLGAFIEASLTNQKYSHRKFARLLDIDEDLAEGILGGVLPASEIDDDLLINIARVIRHEPNTLRIILGRPIIPTRNSGTTISHNGAGRRS